MDIERLRQYKAEPLRYHLVISRELPQEEGIWNIGHSVASFLLEKKDDEYLPELFDELCNKLSRQYIGNLGEVDNVLQVTHYGVLFEPKLKFDINAFFSKLAKNSLLVLYTNGIIQNDKLYLTNNESDYYINLNEFNYIVL